MRLWNVAASHKIIPTGQDTPAVGRSVRQVLNQKVVQIYLEEKKRRVAKLHFIQTVIHTVDRPEQNAVIDRKHVQDVPELSLSVSPATLKDKRV